MKDKKVLAIILVAVLLLGGLASINAKTVLSDYIMSLIKGGKGECGDQCSCSEESDCSGSEPECGGVKTCADAGCKGTGCGDVCSEKYCDKYETSGSDWSCGGQGADCICGGGTTCNCAKHCPSATDESSTKPCKGKKNCKIDGCKGQGCQCGDYCPNAGMPCGGQVTCKESGCQGKRCNCKDKICPSASEKKWACGGQTRPCKCGCGTCKPVCRRFR